jgi:hypothetical protein
MAGLHPIQAKQSKSVLPSQANELLDSPAAAQSITAQALGHSAQMLTAQPESGIYCGLVIGETACHLIQRQSAHSGIAHLKNLLDRQPRVGDRVRIHYANSKGTVREVQERAKGAELGR